MVHCEVKNYVKERLPAGCYREDGLIPVSDKHCMRMPKAKREDLVAWSGLERDPENLLYITSRLAIWDEVKYPTLADFERSLTEELPSILSLRSS